MSRISLSWKNGNYDNFDESPSIYTKISRRISAFNRLITTVPMLSQGASWNAIPVKHPFPTDPTPAKIHDFFWRYQ